MVEFDRRLDQPPRGFAYHMQVGVQRDRISSGRDVASIDQQVRN
jgi:hypothetical protein